ncbi:MAG: YlbF family regulator [Oscillospiraceae bacterium]
MDIIKMTRDLGVAIQESEEFKRINAAKDANDKDVELQNLIEVFNMTRVKLSTAMQAEEKDEDLVAKLDKELKETYTTVMGNKNMLEFNDAKQEIDELMNKINNIIVASVNGEDPLTCDEKPEHSCGGSCGECGGCH